MKIIREELPHFGQPISDFKEGRMPAHKAIVLFFCQWKNMDHSPMAAEYEMLCRVLKEILPKVEWPDDQFSFWSGDKGDYRAHFENYEMFRSWAIEPFGPLFDIADLLRAYENGTFVEYMSRAEIKDARLERIKATFAERPEASKKAVGAVVGVTGQRVGQLLKNDESELKANEPPKLLNNGVKREIRCNDGNISPKMRGNSPEYIKARLTRDADVDPKAKEVLEELESGSTTARQAALKMGWVKPPDIVKQVEKQREKLSVEDQVKIWEQWGRSIPDEAMDRIGIAKEAFLNLDERSQNEFLAWANNVTGDQNGN